MYQITYYFPIFERELHVTLKDGDLLTKKGR